jgi:hypothetical protein
LWGLGSGREIGGRREEGRDREVLGDCERGSQNWHEETEHSANVTPTSRLRLCRCYSNTNGDTLLTLLQRSRIPREVADHSRGHAMSRDLARAEKL